MAHGFSVENLERLEAELFYDDLSLNEVILTLKPVQKEKRTVKDGKEEVSKYYIGEWSYKPAPKELVSKFSSQISGIQIYREDTWNNPELLVALNYSMPVAASAALASGEAGDEVQQIEAKAAE